MGDDYRTIADHYDQSFIWLPYRKPIEERSILKALGPLEGRSVLELATGTGHYSRAVKRRGASRVVGVDISADMVRIARDHEAREPLGIEYLVQDVAELDLGQTFDLVLAAYFLHYATSREHLDRMCQAIGRHLAPGGRFVTYQLNPDFSREPGYYEPYGVRLRAPEHLENGQAFSFTFRLDEDVWTSEITVHYWDWPALVESLTAAGLDDIHRVDLSVSEDAVRDHGMARWEPYLTRPHAMLMQAVKR
jgi:SAM-dependent methyltransferase